MNLRCLQAKQLNVQLAGMLRDAADGAASIELEAATIRELLRKLVERYPKLDEHVQDGVSVSIDGEIYRDRWSEPIPPEAEVFVLPRIPGG